MGIFYAQKKVFNRAPENISVRFDGQEITIPPGEYALPAITIPHGKNQNPVMGTQDPNNPHISGGQYLLAVVGEDDCTPLTPQEWATHLGQPCRMDIQASFEEKYGQDPKAKLVTLGKNRRSTATSRADAGSAPRGDAEFSAKE